MEGQQQVLLMKREQVQEALSQIAGQIILKMTASHPLTDWITEARASDILGYENKQHLRLVARESKIAMSKKGKKYYYSLKSINQYLASGVL